MLNQYKDIINYILMFYLKIYKYLKFRKAELFMMQENCTSFDKYFKFILLITNWQKIIGISRFRELVGVFFFQ